MGRRYKNSSIETLLELQSVLTCTYLGRVSLAKATQIVWQFELRDRITHCSWCVYGRYVQ